MPEAKRNPMHFQPMSWDSLRMHTELGQYRAFLERLGVRTCEIQWVEAPEYLATPDWNAPVGTVRLVAIEGTPLSDVVPQHEHYICAEHLARMPLTGDWLYTPAVRP